MGWSVQTPRCLLVTDSLAPVDSSTLVTAEEMYCEKEKKKCYKCFYAHSTSLMMITTYVVSNVVTWPLPQYREA